jgi:hypothetical protein
LEVGARDIRTPPFLKAPRAVLLLKLKDRKARMLECVLSSAARRCALPVTLGEAGPGAKLEAHEAWRQILRENT